MTAAEGIDLEPLRRCFGGAIPAVLATASADGTPNITYLSRAHLVDRERIALSNQFFSKTARNLAENPRASLLLIDPTTHDEHRLTLVFERTERRGRVFEDLREDVDTIAALTGMQDVFRLRAADIYRVVEVEQIPPNREADACSRPRPTRQTTDLLALAELCRRTSRCADLDALVPTALDGLDSLLGYAHVQLLLLDEEGRRLYTIGSRGFDAENVGSEIAVGDGVTGMAAARCAPIRVGNLQQMAKYSNTVRRSFDAQAGLDPARAIPLPGLAGVDSRLAVPAVSLGQLVGVLVVDSTEPVAFGEADEAALTVVASVIANAIEVIRAEERSAPAEPGAATPVPPPAPVGDTHVRFFPVDGSVFLDGAYLIKGVAGRILWSLLRQHDCDGRVEFTNRELRLDTSLELPGFKDNLESRLLLLTRRLDERGAPVRLQRTGRGRFRIEVSTAVRLDEVS